MTDPRIIFCCDSTQKSGPQGVSLSIKRFLIVQKHWVEKIPTIIFGSGSIASAHKPDEFISIDEYITGIKTAYWDRGLAQRFPLSVPQLF